MKIDGTCHCGGIRYEAEVDPAKVAICHCTDCQTLSGSAFRTVAQTKPGTFRLLSGTLSVYIKTAESGNKREQTFCPTCGTPIYSAPVGPDIKSVVLRVGAIRQRNQLVPRDQFWFRSSQPWLRDMPAMKKQDKQPIFDAKGSFGDH
ncbi:MAG: GFA family protein [Alphaproteobacteria bacterium]